VRDDAILEDIVTRLQATNKFDVVTAGWPWFDPDSCEKRRSAWIERSSWSELEKTTTADLDDDSTVLMRTRIVKFMLILIVRAQDESDPNRAMRMLSQLESIAKNAIEEKRLAEITIPAKTRISTATDMGGLKPPNRAVELTLTTEYRYPINAANETDRA
jgi:hypothetical protein